MRFGRARIIWGLKYRWLSVLLISLGAIAFECAYFAYTMSILESSSRQHASLSDQIHAGIAVLVLLFIYILLVSVFCPVASKERPCEASIPDGWPCGRLSWHFSSDAIKKQA